MKIIMMGLLLVLTSPAALALNRINDFDLKELESKRAQVLITFDEYLKGNPELMVRDNLIQLALPGVAAYPKRERKVSVFSEFDTTLMAYQYNKDLSRVRVILPFDIESHKGQIAVNMQDKSILLSFPVLQVSQQVKEMGVEVKKSRTVKKDLKKNDFDESYLEKLIAEKQKGKPVSMWNDFPEKGKEAPPSQEKKLATDEVSQVAASTESSGEFSMMDYILKLTGFIVLISALFLGGVILFKKGILKRNKFSFLKNGDFINVINTTYIAPKRSLLMVKAFDKVLLLSSSEQGVSFLTELDGLSDVIKKAESSGGMKNFDEQVLAQNERKGIESKFQYKENIHESSDSSILPKMKKKSTGFADKLKRKNNKFKDYQ